MTWWQWPFFCLGVVTALLTGALAIIAFRLTRAAAGVWTSGVGREQPELRDSGLVTSTEARVG
jgi:hypothetical protein